MNLVYYYYFTFFSALFFLLIYIFQWNKRSNVWITVSFVLVPVFNFAGLMLARSTTLEEAVVYTKFTYLSACYIQFCAVMVIATLCQIKFSKWLMAGLFVINTFNFVTIFLGGTLFYKTVTLVEFDGIVTVEKTYGPMHTVVYACTIAMVVLGVGLLVYALLRKKQVPLSILIRLVTTDVVIVSSHCARFLLHPKVEPIALSSSISLALMLSLNYEISQYSVDESVVDSLVEHGNTGFIIFNYKRQFLGCNATAIEYFPTLSTLVVDREMPDNVPEFEAFGTFINAVEHGNKSYVHRFHYLDRCYKLTTDHLNRSKKKDGFVIRIEDITKEDNFQSSLSEYAEEMRKLKEEADRANAAKSIFLANMSHEIRTPINVVLGMDELILRDSTDSTVLDYAANIKSSGTILLSLINEILDLSKIESGKIEINPSDYQLMDLVTACRSMVFLKADVKQLKFNIESGDYLPTTLVGDENRIRQILINILTNAVKYTKEGSVTMNISFVSETDAEGVLVVSVTDTGIGIKPENIDKLFDSFKRIDSNETKYIEGTGLGLAIVKHLLELMDGKITVKSEYGKGSTFTVKIPQKVADATPITDLSAGMKTSDDVGPELANEPVGVFEGRKILVVDDMPINLRITTEFLKNTGAIVDTAGSGEIALRLMREKHYDLILMDHMMPDMNGIETMKVAWGDATIDLSNTPIVMLTANASESSRDEYISEGFADYLSKPFSVGGLMDCIQRNLKR